MLNKIILIFISILQFNSSTIYLVNTICAGCPIVSPINREIQGIAEWTAEQMPTLTCKYCFPNAAYSVQSIESAQTQVVAGTNYFLTIIYSSSLQEEVSFNIRKKNNSSYVQL